MTAVSEDLSGLARGGSLNLIGSAVGALLSMVLVLVVTRGLGAAAGGAFFEVVALFNIVIIVVTLGADTGLVRFTAASIATHGHSGSGRVLVVGLIPVAVLGAVLGVVGTLLAPWLGVALGGAGHAGDIESMVRIVSWFVPLGALSLAMLGATRGYGTLLPTVTAERIGRPAAQLLAAVVVVTSGWGAAELAGGWALGVVLSAAVAGWWLARLKRGRHRSVEPQTAAIWATAKGFWVFTLPRAFASMFRVGVLWLDVVLVGALISPTAAAAYTVATRLLQAGFIAVDAVGQAVEPMFSAALASRAHDRAQSLYEVATGWLVGLTWPLFLAMWVFAGTILSLFGDEISDATSVVAILAASALIGSGFGPVDILLVMAGKSTWSLWNSAASFGLNVGLNLLLIPIWGLDGAALAWAVSRVTANVLPLLQVRSIYGFHPFGRGWRTAAVASILVFGVGGLVAKAIGGTTMTTFLVFLLVALTLYAAIVFRWRSRLDLSAFSAILGARFRSHPMESS